MYPFKFNQKQSLKSAYFEQNYPKIACLARNVPFFPWILYFFKYNMPKNTEHTNCFLYFV